MLHGRTWDGGSCFPSVLLPLQETAPHNVLLRKAWLNTLTELEYAGIRPAEYGDTGHGPEKSRPSLPFPPTSGPDGQTQAFGFGPWIKQICTPAFPRAGGCPPPSSPPFSLPNLVLPSALVITTTHACLAFLSAYWTRFSPSQLLQLSPIDTFSNHLSLA